MRRIDEGLVGQTHELGMQRVVEHPRQLIGAPTHRGAKIGPPDVADEERVAGQDRVRSLHVAVGVMDEDRDRLG